MGPFFHAFFSDVRVQIIFLLIALDLGLGVIVALKNRDFRLAYVADFLRADVLPKVLGFAIFYAGYKYAKNTNIIIPGIDLEVLMNGAWGVVLLALTGSLLGSLKGLGLLAAAPDAIAGPDPSTPAPPGP